MKGGNIVAHIVAKATHIVANRDIF